MQTYRADIDGLRALAVGSVLLFHADVPFAPGGFVGVDVFFVISGFLITGIILKQIEVGEFSILTFYSRRARRLLPALYLVSLFSTALACGILGATELREFTTTLLASVAFVANIVLWAQTDYFAGPANLKPLLHIWSLGVEEQFYLLFPAAVFFLTRTKWMGTTLILMILISLGAAEWMVRRHPDTAFFLLPFRAWELLIGALLAIAPPRSSSRGDALANVASFIGFSAIIFSVATFSKSTLFPGLRALVPCFGAAAIIWSGSAHSLVNRLLSLRPIVFIGLISYPLYLWHWPLLSFGRNYVLRPLLPYETLALMIVAVALATVTYLKLERPLRDFRVSRSITLNASLAASLVLSAGAGLAMVSREASLQKSAKVFETYANRDPAETLRPHECFLGRDEPPEVYNRLACFEGSGRKPRLLIFGDSYGAHYWHGFNEVFGDEADVLLAAASSCPPLIGYLNPSITSCAPQRDRFFKMISELPPEVIVLAALWQGFSYDPHLETTLEGLTKLGSKVILLGPSPIYTNKIALILAREPRSPDSERYMEPSTRPTDAAMKARYAGRKDVTYISVLDQACGSQCPFMADGLPVSWDMGHLNAIGSTLFARKLRPAILPVLENLR